MMLSLLIRSLLIYCFTLIITDNEDYFTLQHYVLSLFNTKHAIFCSSEWIVIGLENFFSCIFSHGIYFLIYHTKCMCRIKTSFTINIYIYIKLLNEYLKKKRLQDLQQNFNVDIIFYCQCFLSYICENLWVILNIQTSFKKSLKGLI